MPLAPCPDCGNQCSLAAFTCPKCGRPLTEEELKNSKKLISLTQFISDNKDLLTAASVLTALSVFWNNASLKALGSFLSFLCLTATVPILLEIHRKFNDLKSAWLTVIFTSIFSLLVGYTAWYVLVDFRPQWQTQMWKVVTWGFFIPLWILYRHIDKPKLFKKLGRFFARKFKLSEKEQKEFVQDFAERDKDKDEISIFLLHALVFIALLGICGLIANYLAPVANKKLDVIYANYKSENPTPTPSPASIIPALENTPTPTPQQNPSPASSPPSVSNSTP
jgi:hypothetical protein